MTVVAALGGNALLQPGERGTAAEQRANLREACAALRPLLARGPAVVTHGNGPQAGSMLLRHERAADEAPPHPLWLVVAETQAEIGALAALELRAAAGAPAAAVLTHVVVAEDDPAFEEPTKPIGPHYAEAEARALERERGWTLGSEAGRGWRRLVASPAPREIVELPAIRALLAAGTIVVACGGGGIPVVRRGERLDGIDAVIDKDRASALLAVELGAELLVILTDVPAVFRDYRGPSEQELRRLAPADADGLLEELPPGSMRPKVEAAAAFVRATGSEALITSAAALEAALAGEAGTRLAP